MCNKKMIVNDSYVEFNKNIKAAILRKHPEFRNKFAYISKFEITGDNNFFVEFQTSFIPILSKKEAVILHFSDLITTIN